jgi:hypothetical protein
MTILVYNKIGDTKITTFESEVIPRIGESIIFNLCSYKIYDVEYRYSNDGKLEHIIIFLEYK